VFSGGILVFLLTLVLKGAEIMGAKNTHPSYGFVTKTLHAVVLLCILFQIFAGFFHGDYPAAAGTLMMIHKSIGLTLIPIMLFFILWTLANKKPSWPAEMSCCERFLAKLVHVMLYAVVLMMSLSGWYMATAAGYVPVWFNLIKIAAPGVVKNAGVAHFMGNIHEFMAWTLISLLVLHVLGALKHHFVNKDAVLKGMF
jgi:cytochrome b561